MLELQAVRCADSARHAWLAGGAGGAACTILVEYSCESNVSSIRLFILASIGELGPMHGHRLRQVAERKRVPYWTDISVGSVYGAMKRLAGEGLLRKARREQEGNRPTRQLYEITDRGKRMLADLRRDGLGEIWFKYDPFDLALTRIDSAELAELPSLLSDRLARMTALLEERRRMIREALRSLGMAEQWAARHTERRMETEVRYLKDLLAALPDIIADVRHPRPKSVGRLPSRAS